MSEQLPERNPNQPRAQRGDGRPVNPGDAVVPILKEVGAKRLAVIGTGFYVTRYGLFVTAKHVVQALTDDGKSLGICYVCHLVGDDEVHLRQIRRAHCAGAVDVAVAQADNFMEKYPSNPLINLRVSLSTRLPPADTPLITYGYPENKVLDFTRPDPVPELRGDFFEGGFLRFVAEPENPRLKFPYFETTIGLRPGTSGGPVFYDGQVIGINCAGWDFRGAEYEGESLSYIVPIQHLLAIKVDLFMVPPQSWEANQVPESRRGTKLSFRELAEFGHVDLRA